MTRLLIAAVAALLIAVPASSRAQEPAQVVAVLDLTLNTVKHGEIRVVLAGDDVWADVGALEAAGLRRFGGTRRPAGDRAYVRLSSIDPPLAVTVDDEALTLTITADASLFGETTLRFDSGRPEGIITRRVPSAFLNYGATWATSSGRALNLESGLSLGPALFTSSFFLGSYGNSSRGLSSAIVDDPSRLVRYQVGDSVVGTGPLGGSLQLGGVVVSRDFSLDPYFIRYPTTGLSGVVTTPSRIDVYVNNQLVRSTQVQPGAYQLANLVLPTGAADTRVVVRDAFGGQQEFGGSYYVTTSVLAKGLQQFQYAFGAERLRPFDTLWDYGRPVLTGVHRVGLTNSVTLGGRIEAESGLASLGPTVSARVGRFGAVEVSAGASRHAGSTGIAGGIAYEYVGRPGSLAFAVRQASDAYETLTTRRMASAPTREVNANATARLGGRATLGLSWQAHEMRGTDVGGDVRRATLSSTISITRRVSIFLSASRDRFDGLWSNGAFASLSVGLGARTMASASIETREGRALPGVELQQSAPIGPGFGYRVQAAGLGDAAHVVEGDLRAQTRWAQLDVHQFTSDGSRETWAQLNGSLVAIGGRVLAARPVQDGFALVRVPAVKGVRAYVSQQEMGRTDRHGDLLVPNLLAYYGNQISIADSDVPVDRTLIRRQLLLATPYRGGAIAEFPATRDWRVAGSLFVPGNPSALRGQHALDAVVTVVTPSRTIESWLGAEGELYLEGIGPGRFVVDVASGDFRCQATLVVAESLAPVVQVGALACGPPSQEQGR